MAQQLVFSFAQPGIPQLPANLGTFLNWPGRKAWATAHLLPLIPTGAQRLVDVFTGSGTVSLELADRFASVLISDANPDLIRTFERAHANPQGLIADAKPLFAAAFNADVYSKKRALFNSGGINRSAALFTFLNNASRAGEVRYNKQKEFNTSPNGHRSSLREEQIVGFSLRLPHASFETADFRTTIGKTGTGDFVVCDPPYLDSKITYFWNAFTESDHRDLAKQARDAADRGATVVVFNHDNEKTRKIYNDAGVSKFLSAPVARKGGKRELVQELMAVFSPRAVPSPKVAGVNSAVPQISVQGVFNEHGVIETPDLVEQFTSPSGETHAEIQAARVGDTWIAEYFFDFHSGAKEGVSLPLCLTSHRFASRLEAMSDAAKRMLDDATHQCGNVAALPKGQQQDFAELRAWCEAMIAGSIGNDKSLAGFTHADLFAGAGGFRQALESQGASCVFAVEIDKAARETYVANFGQKHPFPEDIRLVRTEDMPSIDILTAGFPCQSFSVAGDGKGFHAPEKGALFFEVVRVAAAKRPKLMILENVPAFVDHDGGDTVRQAHRALNRIGYGVFRKVLDAADFGLPQQRQRVFFVCVRHDVLHSTDWTFAFPGGGDRSRVVDDILEQRVKSERGMAEMNATAPIPAVRQTSPVQVGRIGPRNMQGYRVYSTKGKGITLCAESGGLGAKTGLYLVGRGIRRLTSRECARMQGFPDTFKFHKSDTQARKQFGNAVAVPVVSGIAKAAASFIV